MNKFYLTEEVTECSVQPLVDFLKENHDNDVVIHIDSIGGDVFAGLRIVKAIENHNGIVTAECGIIVASIAAVIALSCHRLTVSKDTFLMIHKPWVYVCGTAEELLSTASLLEQAGNRIKDICTAKAKETAETKDWFIADTWFGCDAILENFNDVELEENVEVNTKVLNMTAKLKTAPEALVAIAAKLQENVEQEDDAQTTINEDDSEETDTETDNTDEDSEILTEETIEVETKETVEEEKEEEPKVDNSLAVSVLNKLNKLNIC